MEKAIIKSNWATMENIDGRLNIILHDDERNIRSARQSKIKDIEITIEGSVCKFSGTKHFFENFWDLKIPADQTDKYDPAYLEFYTKKIWHLFKPNEHIKMARLDGWVQLKETTYISYKTSNWSINDRRKKESDGSDSAPSNTDLSNMD